MASPGRFFADVHRLGQILDVLAKYGFGYLLERLRLDRTRKVRKVTPSPAPASLDLPAPVRVRKALEELGPTFIKLGQILSTRADLIPLRYCIELGKLQDCVPPFPLEEAQAQIEKDLRKSLTELFREFIPEPMAAASLAQVHLATLRNGQEVIVKVQRPRIRAVIDEDFDILAQLARLANRYLAEWRPYNPVQLVHEFRQSILKELDFTLEAANNQRIHEQFKGDETVYIPRIHQELSTSRVLVMERVKGIKITELEALQEAGLDRRLLAIRGANAFLRQIFVFGFFHADPHPGNLFALPGNRVAFIDFGMIGRLHKETKEQIAAMLVAIANHDIHRLLEAAMALGAVDEDAPLQRLSWDLEDLLDRHYVSSLKSFKVGDALKDLLNVMSRYHMHMPPEMTMLSKTLITIEGVGETLDPDFDMVALTKPFAQKLISERYSLDAMAWDLRGMAETLYNLVVSLPKNMQWIMDKLKKGTLGLKFQLKGLERLILTLERASNRLSFSLIVAAIIVGSSIVLIADKGPHLLGYPAIGLVGFLAAGLMGLWLVISILRSGRF
jgi:ubiquinone biosynthesis protein